MTNKIQPILDDSGRGHRVVLTDEDSMDDAQASGRWIASPAAVSLGDYE